jgi:signal transduction histidine kinase
MADATAKRTGSQHLARLLEISRILASTHDLQRLLEAVVNVASELTGSEKASILLYDARAGQLRFEAAPGTHQEQLRKIQVPLDTSVAGKVFSSRRPLLVQNASADPRIFREVDQALGFRTHSVLAVPLLIKQEPIGVLEAVNKKEQGHYTEDDLEILWALAAQAAIAIDNARLLRKLQKANQELRRLDYLKSNFIAIASHELRTPLGLVLGHATYLREMLPGEFSEQIEVIVRSALRLKELIEDMASIAHKEQGLARVRLGQFSMREMARQVVMRFEAEAREKDIALGLDLPPDNSLLISGDREKLDLALSNLVRNALTFTDPGGKVGVRAETDGSFIKVFVADTGIGIPETEIERVFDRFYQVESHLTRKHGGMGLGLSIAKAMVEMHDGQIWCESKEGVGSLFWFVVPINPQKSNPTGKVFAS